MPRYLIRRLVTSVIVLILLTTFLALLPHLISGDVVQTILGPRASPQLDQVVRQQMGLDKPVLTQVVDFTVNALHGNLGRDFITQLPVMSLILSVLPNTVILTLVSLLIAVLVGLPLGIAAAVRQDRWADRVINLISVSFVTLPAYVVGLLLLIVFAVSMHLLPAIGNGNAGDPVDYARHLILPALALALSWAGYFTRLVRSSMLEVLAQDHIRTARALGLRNRIIYAYAAKNAVIPVVAVLGVGFGTLMSAAIFVEAIFTRSGLGTLVLTALLERNYTVVRGGVLVIAVFVMLGNLLSDVSYRFLDPRIRVSARS